MDIDKDYIEYLRGMGKFTKEQELILDYLGYISHMLEKLMDSLPEEDNKKINLMGQYKIQPPSGGGARKGPPPIIV